MGAARNGRWTTAEARVPASEADGDLHGLLTELDRPLMPGFMTAGYSELGRYIFLAAQMHDGEPLRLA